MENLDPQTIKALLISNAVLFAFFLVQKGVELFLHFFKKDKEKKEASFDTLSKQVTDLSNQVIQLKAQMDLGMKYLFKVGVIEQDFHALFDKLRAMNLKD